jgi:drug/metabolite transporter (DMT)-like permease
MLTKHRGEFYLVMGALVFSFNGIVSTIVLEHISPFRLAQVRSCSAFVLLLLVAIAVDRKSLAVKGSEIPGLAAYGIIGFAAVQAGYFLGIQRGLPLSLVLIIEFSAPIWIALWIKYVRKAFVPGSMWLAIALSLLGLILLAQVWKGLTFDAIGLLGALFSALALTGYFLIGKKVGVSRSALSLTVWGLGMASLTWILVMPVWNFPFKVFMTQMDLQGIFEGNTLPGWALIGWIVIMGTIVPYLFVIAGLRLLSESTSSVIGMLEPVLAGIFAWIFLLQSWNAIQLFGAAVVLVGIYIADRARSVSA